MSAADHAVRPEPEGTRLTAVARPAGIDAVAAAARRVSEAACGAVGGADQLGDLARRVGAPVR